MTAANQELAYNPAVHPHQAALFCQRGATDREIAELFQISPATFYKWRNTYPEFALSMKLGKEEVDDRVERSLYNRAVGYDYDSEKLVTVSVGDNGGSVVERHAIVVHVPPDVKAATRWLEARRPKVWKRTLGISVSEDDADDTQLDNLDDTERAALRGLLSKAVGGAQSSEG